MDFVATDVKLTVPEVARRLQIPGGKIYRLVFQGALPGSPEGDGAVYIPEDAVTAYAATKRPGLSQT